MREEVRKVECITNNNNRGVLSWPFMISVAQHTLPSNCIMHNAHSVVIATANKINVPAAVPTDTGMYRLIDNL